MGREISEMGLTRDLQREGVLFACMCVCVRRICELYRHFRHPDRFGLLVADLVLQSLVPMVGAGLQINTC